MTFIHGAHDVLPWCSHIGNLPSKKATRRDKQVTKNDRFYSKDMALLENFTDISLVI